MPGSYVRELGQTLREARETRGVSLAEAQQATKIRQAFLQALEQENYGVLPPPVYIRGFLKTYSNYLGLDSQEVVQAFDELMEAVAMGINPYQGSGDSGGADSGSADSGSADSGGRGIYMAAPLPAQAGLTQGEADMLGDTAEILRVTPEGAGAEKPADGEVVQPEPVAPPVVVQTQTQALATRRRNTSSLNALRVPEKYVLRPAIPPLNKPSFYIPNFMPALAVLIIVAAALLLVYQGTAAPRNNDAQKVTTATPNVYSAPTVTPLGNVAPVKVVNNTAGATSTSASNTIVPNPTVLANIAAGTSGQLQATTVAAATTAPVVLQPVKIEIVVNDGSSWVQVWVDDKPVLNKLAKSETLTFEGKDKVEVALGKPGAVKLLVNGQEKQYAPPNSGTVIKVFKADGSESIIPAR